MNGPTITLEAESIAARRLSNFLARHGSELDTEDALAIARGAVSLAPVSESYNALAGVLNEIPGSEALQVAAADAALGDDPENWAAWHNKSLALLRLHEGVEAAKAISHALRLLPESEANPYLAMQAAFVAGIRGEHEDALGYLVEAEAAAARLNSANPKEAKLAATVRNECCIARFVAYANLGKWANAFAALSNRHKTNPVWSIVSEAEAGGRLWKPGMPAAFKTAIVVLEWGLGDQIQFARYVPEFVRRGIFENVLVACSAPLASLMKSLEGVRGTVDRDGLVRGDLDDAELVAVIDLMADHWERTGDPTGGSLGEKYLSAPGYSSGDFERAGKPVLAFSWQGDPRQTHDWNRRLPLADFGAWAAANRERFSFVSLQTRFAGYGEPWAGWPDDLPVKDVAASLITPDLGEIADWMMEADVFVGQCGGLVHLAGALGKPGVVMLAASHDWRWDQSPRLYGSIVPVEQSASGDWPSAFAKLTDAIAGLGVTPHPTANDQPKREDSAEASATGHSDRPAAEPEPEPNFAHMGDEETAAYFARKANGGVAPAPVVVETLAPQAVPIVEVEQSPAGRLTRREILARENQQGVEYPAAVEPVGAAAAADVPAEVTEQPAEPAAIPTEGETQQ